MACFSATQVGRLQAPGRRNSTAAAAPALAAKAAAAAVVRHPSAASQRRLALRIAAAASSGEAGSSGAASSAATAAQPAAWTSRKWLWKGHTVNYATAGCGPPVMLVHGFGASSRHFRKNYSALVEAGYKVYAVDLLGQGASDKPAIDYSMELWRDQLIDFWSEFVQSPTVLVGNSIGSLASLMVAEAAPAGAVSGLVLLNCAGGMNNKAISDDWRIKLALPIFWLIDFLLQRPSVARSLFDRFRQPDNLRQVLLNVYGNAESVDDELVDLIHTPSCDEGALDAFVSIITGPPGPRPDHLLASGAVKQPLLVLWGDADPFTPADGPVGRFFQALPESRPDTQFTFLPGVGHCPHDDDPAAVHAELLPWLATVQPPLAR